MTREPLVNLFSCELSHIDLLDFDLLLPNRVIVRTEFFVHFKQLHARVPTRFLDRHLCEVVLAPTRRKPLLDLRVVFEFSASG